jgi:hypothetical protein
MLGEWGEKSSFEISYIESTFGQLNSVSEMGSTFYAGKWTE